MSNSGNFGLSLFGMDPYGSMPAAFGVAGATSYSPHFVQVRFTDIIDVTDSVFTDPSNYSISPLLVVHSVSIESADSVILQTDGQAAIVYTVTVSAARSFFGIPMVPPNNTATFTGLAAGVSGYFAVGTTPTRIRCIFSNEMLVNAALTDPTQYVVTDLNGGVLLVLSAQTEQTTNVLSVVLTLGVPMQTTVWYETTVSPAIVTFMGDPIRPAKVDFQWVLPVQNVTVPISEFTGEVEGGPFGDPDGLVFFSPSLNVAASNSTIQVAPLLDPHGVVLVEAVAVCTTAYDQYTFPPQHPDPAPFYVWSTIGPQTTLGEQGIVLFGGFPSLGEVSFSFGMRPPVTFDQMPMAFDNSCSITIAAGFAPGFVALLNNPAYWLFEFVPETAAIIGSSSLSASAVVQHHAQASFVAGSTLAPQKNSATTSIMGAASVSAAAGLHQFAMAAIVARSSALVRFGSEGALSTPPMFICANNGAPIPPGSETIIVLYMAIAGNSIMTVQAPSVVHWAATNIHANSTLTTSPQIAPTNLAANSYMRVARPHVVSGASTHMVGGSTFHIESPQNEQASCVIVGYAIVEAHVKTNWFATTAIQGNATIFTRASRNQHISAAITANSTMSYAVNQPTKGPIATAAIVGGSTVVGNAIRNHPVSASLSGHSAVNASAT